MKMLANEKQYFVDNVHAAIVVRVEDDLQLARAKEILSAVEGAVSNDTTVVDDCRPLWLHFDSVSDTKLKFLTGYAPDSRKWIDSLVKSIEGDVGYTFVSRYDQAKVTGKPKPKETTITVRDYSQPFERFKGFPEQPKVKVVRNLLNAAKLPNDLKFFACEEAYEECEKLGETLSRWPLHGFSNDAMEKWMTSFVRRLEQVYPYIAEADRVIGGKLTSAMLALGKNPHQPPFERNRFWMVIRRAAVCSWAQMSDELMAVIDSGKGDHTKLLEESVTVSKRI